MSLGVFHTLAVTATGKTYAWGQNKYGKLGVHYANLEESEPKLLPTKISLYKTPHHSGSEPKPVKHDHVLSVIAAQHHSMAL
jgi:alpha-tubulin suppressor-like RCC1 family protein